MKLIGLALGIILLFSTPKAMAEVQRLSIELSFSTPLSKDVSILLDELNVVLKQLKPYAVDVTALENTTKTHICRHDDNGSCIEEKELTTEKFVKPTPTPK